MGILSAVWGFLSTKVGRTVALVGAAVVITIGAIFRIKSWGAREAEARRQVETQKKAQEARNEADKIRKDLSGASDDDLDQRLRDAGL